MSTDLTWRTIYGCGWMAAGCAPGGDEDPVTSGCWRWWCCNERRNEVCANKYEKSHTLKLIWFLCWIRNPLFCVNNSAAHFMEVSPSRGFRLYPLLSGYLFTLIWTELFALFLRIRETRPDFIHPNHPSSQMVLSSRPSFKWIVVVVGFLAGGEKGELHSGGLVL